MGRKNTKLDFASIVGAGENPKGFISQTANGTGKDKGSGWNKGWDYECPQVPAEGAWNNGGNRTAE